MTSTSEPFSPKRIKRLAAAALMVGVTIGAAAVASAEPREWDIGEYDSCVSAGNGHNYSDAEWDAHYQYCCYISGGNWVPDAGVGHKCTAPAALQQVDPGPTVAPPVLQPVQPSPPVITVAPRGHNSGTLG